MRWFWIDRFIEFESGKRATSVKTVSLAEEQVHDHFPSAPIMPNSLIIEGMALTGGLLAAERGDWRNRVILAKISKAVFHLSATPGDTLTYRATLEDYNDTGAVATIRSHIGDELQAETQVFYAYVDETFAGKSLFKPGQLYDMLRVFRLFEVGKAADGSPLQPNDVLLNDGYCY
jgi:3-hydroxyacyl-[acyl-carrier-protein] dehydratase